MEITVLTSKPNIRLSRHEGKAVFCKFYMRQGFIQLTLVKGGLYQQLDKSCLLKV